MKHVIVSSIALAAAGAAIALGRVQDRRQEAEIAKLRAAVAAFPSAAPQPIYQLLVESGASTTSAASAASCPAAPSNDSQPAAAAEAQPPDGANTPAPSVDDLEAEFATRQSAALDRSRQATVAARATAALPKTSRLEPIECRGNLCKVETEHETTELFAAFVDSWLLHAGNEQSPGSVFFDQAQVAAGKLRSVAYVVEATED